MAHSTLCLLGNVLSVFLAKKIAGFSFNADFMGPERNTGSQSAHCFEKAMNHYFFLINLIV
jgi:hypothetical protein